MLKTKKIMAAACAALIGLAFIGCDFNLSGSINGKDGNDGKDDEKSETSAVDFTDYATNFAITVKNNSTKNMVLFKGEPTQNNLIGGVKASSTSHIKKDGTYFASTQDFVVYVVTEDDYLANKDSDDGLAKLTAAPYSTFYAVFNTLTQNDTVYQISSLLSGQYKIIVNNGSKYNVELRNKGLNGETLAYSESMSFEKDYHLGEGEYMIFSVFRKFDKASSEILSVYPTYASGTLAGEPKSFEFSLDEETTERQFNVKKWVSGIKFNPSAAYIKITNNADQGLQFFTGADSTPLITSAGGKRINTGKSLTYSIDMARTGNTTFEESVIAAGYRLGTNRIDDIYLNGSASATQEYKAGYLYSYTVSGDPETGYTVTPVMEDVGKTITIVDSPAYVDEEGVEKAAVTHEETLTERVIKATPVDWSTF